MSIKENHPCLDLAAFENKDRLTGEKWNGGEYHGGLQTLLLSHNKAGEGIREIRIDGVSDMPGAIRFALRLDQNVNRIFVHSAGKKEHQLFKLDDGAWRPYTVQTA